MLRKGRKQKDSKSFHGKTLLFRVSRRLFLVSCSACNSRLKARLVSPSSSSLQLPPGRPQFKGAQRGGKSTEKEPTQPKSWRSKKARVSYRLLFREIKRRDVWHSRISERKTSHVSPPTTQASQRSYLNSSMHQFSLTVN